MPKQLGSVVELGLPMRGVGPFLFASRLIDKYPNSTPDSLGPEPSLLAGHSIGNDFRNPIGWSMYHGRKVPGFPAHPHRGFETLSIVRDGVIDHADSTGAGARYGKGDLQWVTAGRGVSHSEMFPMLSKTDPNPFSMYQIWLNLPSYAKKAKPEFKMLWTEDVPTIVKENAHGRATARIFAGKFDNVTPPSPPVASWASNPDADVAVWLITLEPGASIKLPAPKSDQTKRLVYVLDAPVEVGGTRVDAGQGWSQEVPERVTLTAAKVAGSTKNAEVLVLQGIEIDEPIARQGPFVMNTDDEVRQAYSDYQQTQFGGWPWPSEAMTYDRDETRFAKHGDGKTERPGVKA